MSAGRGIKKKYCENSHEKISKSALTWGGAQRQRQRDNSLCKGNNGRKIVIYLKQYAEVGRR